jgi:uncharacterized protein YjbJ (UPF0337 family)
MNKDQIKGEWDELKGRVKLAYAELTDDDFARAQGSRDKLIGIIEQRFGESKERIIRKLEGTHVATRPGSRPAEVPRR